MLPSEVFISHSSLDQPFAALITAVLQRHGVPFWLSRRNLIGAQQWHDEIGAALKRCDWFVVILSPNSVASKWVKRELLFALNDDHYEGRIVPLLHQPCEYGDLSWTLSLLEMVDFVEDFDRGCRELMRVWGLGYKK
ncbi:MAG TPA: toll/interleukin-1 receptor domain-containing protein [Pyrinomonadaceae bacterium]|nr:toll/interleukin-1 receptor domain-containing protein [Pyrinomonadaceae bacterium]